MINSRDQNHVCDTTAVEWTIREVGGEKHVWDLAADVVLSLHAGNPHADRYGHAETWHFLARNNSPTPQTTVPPGSVLAKWRAAVLDSRPTEELTQLRQRRATRSDDGSSSRIRVAE